MTQQTSTNGAMKHVPCTDELKYLWDEYKYRHQLCWSAVYKVTIAVVALAVVPYAQYKLIEDLHLGKWVLLVPPLIGTILAGFGIKLVLNELDLFGKTKLAYVTFQNKFYEDKIVDTEIRKHVMEKIKPRSKTRTPFDIYVLVFMSGLTILSFLNLCYFVYRAIPCS